MPEQLTGKHQAQHRTVLDAIADQQRLLVQLRQRRNQLGFRPALQAQAIRSPGIENLVDNLVQLIDLDRIDAAIHVAVTGLVDGGGKSLVQAPDLRAQDVLKADQNRKLDPAQAQLVDDRDDIQGRILVVMRVDGHVTVLVDEKIGLAPAFDPIKLAGLTDGPGGRPVFTDLRDHLRAPARRRRSAARRWLHPTR